ncbi:MAG: hypothetical protein V1837_03300 [Candidatus Woesearchaeota archaeon]
MRKIFLFAALAIMLTSIVIAESENMANSPKTGHAEPKQGVLAAKAQNALARLNETKSLKCINFLQEQNLSLDPGETCSQLMSRELDCTSFLEENGIAEPEARCKSLLQSIWTVSALKPFTQIKDKIATHKAEQIDKMLAKKDEAKDFLNNLTEEKARVFAHLTMAQQRNLMNMSIIKAKNAMKKMQLKVVKKELQFTRRELSKEQKNKSKHLLERAKEQYKQANDEYKQQKELFEQAKKGNCTDCQAQLLTHAKEMVINGAEMMINHLEKVKETVAGSTDMTNSTVEAIINQIDDYIAQLQGIIADATNATTKEEVKASAQEAATLWKQIQEKEKIYTGQLLNSKVWNVVQRSENLEQRLDEAITKLQEKGINTTNIGEKLLNFSSSIAAAKEKYAQAQALLDSARTSNQTSQLVKDARDLLNEAQDKVKEAHAILMQIVQEIHSKGVEVPEESNQGLGDNETYQIVEG